MLYNYSLYRGSVGLSIFLSSCFYFRRMKYVMVMKPGTCINQSNTNVEQKKYLVTLAVLSEIHIL